MGYRRPGRVRAAATHVLLQVARHPHRVRHRHPGLARQRLRQVDRRGAVHLRTDDPRHPRRVQVRPPPARRLARSLVQCLHLARRGRARGAGDRRARVQGVQRAADRGRRRRVRGRDAREHAHARGRPRARPPAAPRARPPRERVGGALLRRLLAAAAVRSRALRVAVPGRFLVPVFAEMLWLLGCSVARFSFSFLYAWTDALLSKPPRTRYLTHSRRRPPHMSFLVSPPARHSTHATPFHPTPSRYRSSSP